MWKELVARVSARLAARRGELVGLTLLTGALWLAGGMVRWAALVALASGLVWALVTPATAIRRATPRDEDADPDAAGRVSAILQAVPAPILALDRAGRLLDANRRARDLFGAAAKGQHLSQFRRAPELLEAMEDALASRTTRVVDLVDRVPIERCLRATLSPVGSEAPGAGLPALLVFVEDLTEQQQLAEMRADFVANASHELRTPLTSLKGFVETLRGAAKDDPVARGRFLAIMQTETSRMTRLIDDLLSLSRIEMREHVPPQGNVDVTDVVDHAVKTLTPLAEGANISIASPARDGTVLVRGDRDELIQVLQNLIENAIKYGRRGGRIDISMRREAASLGAGDRIAIAVADDGPGVAPEHLPRLTERFYRVSADRSREKGGTGLGLAIVKHIVNRHAGELRIASKLGQGSTFTVLLPAVG